MPPKSQRISMSIFDLQQKAHAEPEEGCLCAHCDTGYLEYRPDGECTCHCSPMPPCGSCENSTLICTYCGESAQTEEPEMSQQETINLLLLEKPEVNLIRVNTGSTSIIAMNPLGLVLSEGDRVILDQGKFGAICEVEEVGVPVTALKGHYRNLIYIAGLVESAAYDLLTERLENLRHELALSEVRDQLAKRAEMLGETTLNNARAILGGADENGDA